MNKAFSYNSGCWQLLSGFLFNPSDARWLWHRRKNFTIVNIKIGSKRENRDRFCSSSCGIQGEWGRKPCRGVSQQSTRSRNSWTMAKVLIDVKAVVESLMWTVTSYGMLFEAGPGRPCADMQGDLGLQRRLCDELSLNLEQSILSLWKDHCSQLLSTPSTFNVLKCSLITWSLRRLQGWASSQMKRLRLSILWDTEVKPLRVAWGRERECPHFVKN